MFKAITSIQERDACLALTFLLLLIWFFCSLPWLVYLAMLALLLGMVWPALMRPVAFAWFGLAKVMGGIVSSILLTIVWLVLVVPVGLIRQAMGRDALGLQKWHDKAASCFTNRDHKFTREDLQNPY